ncbi:multidrug efflux SMR transporter [Paenibacillus sp. SI8]|uniref:DMT family transporter n=1 Tax=unclassified Paenibacillus TaxID=185978 RepID=UPI0034658A8A
MKKGYLLLSVAILFEVFGTSMLKVSKGFTVLAPTIGVVFGMGAAFFFLSLSLRNLPLSLAYAIWAGVGTALTALIGVLIWGEAFSIVTVLGLIFIIGGVVLLNFSKTSAKATSPSN